MTAIISNKYATKLIQSKRKGQNTYSTVDLSLHRHLKIIPLIFLLYTTLYYVDGGTYNAHEAP